MCYDENAFFGVWPSGKAVGSEPSMLWFESRYPSHKKTNFMRSWLFLWSGIWIIYKLNYYLIL